jgi:hypothetical protein
MDTAATIPARSIGPGFASVPMEISACEETGMTKPYFMTIEKRGNGAHDQGWRGAST